MATLQHYVADPDVRRARLAEPPRVTGVDAPSPTPATARSSHLERRGQAPHAHHAERGRPPPEGGLRPGPRRRDPRHHARGDVSRVRRAGARPGSHASPCAFARRGRNTPCRSCGGILKSATICSGRAAWSPEDLERAQERTLYLADLLLVVGLDARACIPIAGVVPAAKAAGARVIIVNGDPTAMDHLADVVLNGRIGEILPPLVAAD